MTFERCDLARVRRLVRRQAEQVGLPEDRADDLVLAVNELAANSVDHGGGRGDVRAWCEPGALVVEVRDAGRMAVRQGPVPAPGTDQPRGRGLWLAQQLADAFHIDSGPRGTTARVVALV